MASLDTLRTNGNEFQRADCAPRSCGNGRLSIADWVQAGRYAASLDTLVPACGPTNPTAAMIVVSQTAGARTVRIPEIKLTPGQMKLSLPVELDAQGDENALGFSLNFDPVILKFDTVAAGNGASGATLLASLAQKNSGRIGIALALPAGRSLRRVCARLWWSRSQSRPILCPRQR